MALTYGYLVGKIRVTVLNGGGGSFPIANFDGRFIGVSLEAFKQARAEMDASTETTESSINPFLIETDGQTILVDTGLGGENDAVVAALATSDIQPEDIDTVFITHLHPDHFNGLLTPDGTLTYPNATVKIVEEEWNGWMTDAALDAVSQSDQRLAEGLKTKVLPIKERGILEIVQFGDELAEGVTLFDAIGHTPGHTGLMIESEGEKLFCVVDVAHQTVQMVHPEWSIIFDTAPEDTPATRERLFSRAADEHLLTLFHHFSFPGLGHVTRKDGAYRWNPIDAD